MRHRCVRIEPNANRDRDGDCHGDCDRNQDADPNRDQHCDRDGNRYRHGDIDRHCNRDNYGDSHCHRNTNGHRNRDSHCDRNSHRNRDGHCERHCHCDGNEYRHADRHLNSQAKAASTQRRAENGEIQKSPHGKRRDKIGHAAEQEQDDERCSLGAADDGTILQHREQRLRGRDRAARDLRDRRELCPDGTWYEQRNTHLHRSIEEQQSPGEAQWGRCRDARIDALPDCHINFQCHAKSDRHRRHAHRDAQRNADRDRDILAHGD